MKIEINCVVLHKQFGKGIVKEIFGVFTQYCEVQFYQGLIVVNIDTLEIIENGK